MTTPALKESIANTVKIYLFPSLVTVLAMLIWRDVGDLRSDVKSLLAQSNIDKTRIEILERQVQMLDQAVFLKRAAVVDAEPVHSYPTNKIPTTTDSAKHEQIYTIENNIIKEITK